MASALSTELGKCIRALRVERGWAQMDLAVHAGVARSHLSNVETGRREVGLGILAKIAEALDTTPADLLFQAQSAKK